MNYSCHIKIVTKIDKEYHSFSLTLRKAKEICVDSKNKTITEASWSPSYSYVFFYDQEIKNEEDGYLLVSLYGRLKTVISVSQKNPSDAARQAFNYLSKSEYKDAKELAEKIMPYITKYAREIFLNDCLVEVIITTRPNGVSRIYKTFHDGNKTMREII